jgi:hypothetical protein
MAKAPSVVLRQGSTVSEMSHQCPGPQCDDEANANVPRRHPVSPNPIGSRMEQLAQSVAERVVTLVLNSIDLDTLLDRVDVNKIVERVDVERVVERVDVERIVERVDIQKIVERIDVNSIVDKLDIDSLVEQTELGSIIARSTTGALTELLDVVRSQGVGLDDFFSKWANRIVGRKTTALPLGPPLLVPEGATT